MTTRPTLPHRVHLTPAPVQVNPSDLHINFCCAAGIRDYAAHRLTRYSVLTGR